jgi:FkbM family methyltransferase
MADALALELERLLGEDLVAAEERGRTTFDRLAAPWGDALVLCGAGGLGRKTLAGLRSQGVEPLAFADNNPRLWNTAVDGLTVLEPAEAARRFGQTAAFVVTIWRAGGTHRLEQSRRQFEGLGCSRVVSFAPLFWKYAGAFLPYYCLDLPHKVLADAAQVRRAFRLWADDRSRREFVDQVRWRLLLDFDGLTSPVIEEQYFPTSLFGLRPDEVFVDCGAFDGDTVKSVVGRQGDRFSRIVALEPDPINFEKMRGYCATLPEPARARIDLRQLAAGRRRETLRFETTGTAASKVGSGSLEVQAVPLDELLASERPTFLKMDIEGAEPDALAGARDVIVRHAPLLAVCVYHAQDHLWRLPLFIRSLRDDYRLFLRPHNEECWDLVCYAVPADRLNGTPERSPLLS